MISPLSVTPVGEIKLKDTVGSRSTVPPLSVGEVVDATVTGKQGGKMTITVKGMSLEASSNIPLAEGQVIHVRISQLSPKILMTPVKVGDTVDGAQQIINNINNFKRDPALLKGMIAAGKDLLSPASIERYRDLMPKTDFAAIKERLDSLIFSKDTFRDYAGRLGLLHEKTIASGQGGERQSQGHADETAGRYPAGRIGKRRRRECLERVGRICRHNGSENRNLPGRQFDEPGKRRPLVSASVSYVW